MDRMAGYFEIRIPGSGRIIFCGFVIMCLAFSVGIVPCDVYAQEAAASASVEEPQVEEEGFVYSSDNTTPWLVSPDDIPSLFFTVWTHRLIKDARTLYKFRQDTDPGPIEDDYEDEIRQPGVREISLGGIVFVKDDEWTVWLNGRRITPKAIPEEVLDISVSREYIELKWMDSYTNTVFPVRLRPHQRFNLDTRIFLPG